MCGLLPLTNRPDVCSNLPEQTIRANHLRKQCQSTDPNLTVRGELTPAIAELASVACEKSQRYCEGRKRRATDDDRKTKILQGIVCIHERDGFELMAFAKERPNKQNVRAWGWRVPAFVEQAARRSPRVEDGVEGILGQGSMRGCITEVCQAVPAPIWPP